MRFAIIRILSAIVLTVSIAGVVVVVLLPFHERLDMDRRNDPRLMAKCPQVSADKVRAQTRDAEGKKPGAKRNQARRRGSWQSAALDLGL